jgi:hypothetical protein
LEDAQWTNIGDGIDCGYTGRATQFHSIDIDP